MTGLYDDIDIDMLDQGTVRDVVAQFQQDTPAFSGLFTGTAAMSENPLLGMWKAAVKVKDSHAVRSDSIRGVVFRVGDSSSGHSGVQ